MNRRRESPPKISTLLYHDVVAGGHFEESGFRGPDADSYKLSADTFARHLESLAQRTGGRGVGVFDALAGRAAPADFVLTFDDGGSSALARIVPLLQRYGWLGHFYITTDRIGTPGFLTREDVRELSRLGHVIGSHSCSHPAMISRLGSTALDREWRDSLAALADVTGTAVSSASVPGGFFSRRVAEAAAAAGIRVLFTSEPTTEVHRVRDCAVLGRYLVRRDTTPATVAALASGDQAARRAQWLSWNARKPFKAIGGAAWLRARKQIFALRGSAQGLR